MSRFSIREIILVLALAVVSTNWALDHRAQSMRQRELEATKKTHEQMLQSIDFPLSQAD